ncbi:DUF1771-domain-containing protein [Punctularia strigosozonata HHB-11173 SS5]|uniref:DUF1771-domain-containing protein n=1 Tax=Punctularia strigosozonata (strain HHB-11173) TaxID=741275 RepID=UPI0004416D8F|nr:DUF1771-domain-containing protein [Punctularia strigosozonata HHB-11173 SS5]EIN11801.1 DUF1771-domain-containing protein [Punctularia strigosozonata HHB-11173 SS5]
MGGLGSLLGAILRIVCGSSSSKEESGAEQPSQGHYPQQPIQQQPQAYPPPQQQPQSPPPQQPHTYAQAAQSPSGAASQQEGFLPDQNQVNQHNEQYMALRAEANEEGDQMSRAFQESHEAYSRGDGAMAKELSNKGKAHQAKMEELNHKASEWIFVENNKDSQPGEVDLHGLYVKEAISYTDRAVQEARQRGDGEIHLITGKGLHSRGHAAKLKPAIEELMVKHQLITELDPQNSGVLIVHLDGRGANRPGALGTDEIAGRLDRDEGCTIM